MRRKQITFNEYIANHDESARSAKKVMERFGYTVDYRDEPGFVICLNQFLQAENKKGNGEAALMALASVHPDRELILATAPAATTRNFDGFADSVSSERLSANSAVKVAEPIAKQSQQEYAPLLLGAFLVSAFFVTVVMISKK